MVVEMSLLSPSLGSRLFEFKSLTKEMSLYIGLFRPMMTSLSRHLDEAAFSIPISSVMLIFVWLF